MIVAKTISELKESLSKLSIKGSLGLVPTMGYLHEGHLSLVRKSIADNDITVVSIFVNPTQFAPNEDLQTYPRDIEKDRSLLVKEGVDLLFYPEVEEIYPDGYSTYVEVKEITEKLCGRSRPTHFKGVTTIVTKLFNLIKPNNAYFGLKDYQQYRVISKMVEDLNMDINIVGLPIIREGDGLALSSRNYYLSTEQRKSALSLNRSFNLVERLIEKNERDANIIKNEVKNFIEKNSDIVVDYIEIVDIRSLEEIEKVDSSFLIALAVKVGNTRLIDNKIFNLQP